MVSPLKTDDHFLPSRDISYAYAVAMYFAQRFEIDLRAILYTADYHGWIPALELSEEDKKRFKDTEGFVDGATCGKLIEALQKTDWIKEKKALTIFKHACSHRNKLAHSYLATLDFDHLTKKKEEEIILGLYRLTHELYGGLIITRALRERCEIEADKLHASLSEFMKEIGIEFYEDPNRHFSTRKKKK